jgi:hypothetical protein
MSAANLENFTRSRIHNMNTGFARSQAMVSSRFIPWAGMKRADGGKLVLNQQGNATDPTRGVCPFLLVQ